MLAQCASLHFSLSIRTPTENPWAHVETLQFKCLHFGIHNFPLLFLKINFVQQKQFNKCSDLMNLTDVEDFESQRMWNFPGFLIDEFSTTIFSYFNEHTFLWNFNGWPRHFFFFLHYQVKNDFTSQNNHKKCGHISMTWKNEHSFTDSLKKAIQLK